MPKTYTGCVMGVRKLQNDKYILYCETDRLPTDEGNATEVVFSPSYVSVLTNIRYHIIKTRRGYIASV